MLITYPVTKCLRYNKLMTGKVDNQATRKSPHTSSISCKLTFTDKLNQKKDKRLSHLLHFYAAGSFNIQNHFIWLKCVLFSLKEGLLHFCFRRHFETSTQCFKILLRTSLEKELGYLEAEPLEKSSQLGSIITTDLRTRYDDSITRVNFSARLQ